MADAEFAAFYRAEMPAVVRHVMNQGAGEQEAVGAAQTAFVQAYQVWETISHPRAWVRTVATRAFLRSLPWIREIPAGTSLLEQAGVEHEYLLFPDEGHGFAKPENQLRFYTAAERFLARHLGGRAEDEALSSAG